MSNIHKYDDIVRDYTQNKDGLFAVITNDGSFIKTFRNAMFKFLALPYDCTDVFSSREKALKHIRDKMDAQHRVLVLIEREMEGKSNLEFIKYLKTDIPEVAIVVLTGEIERERLILLHEMGVSNFITKPISVNVLVEKIAFTIKPTSKIGELIDAGKRLVSGGDYEKALTISDKVLELKPMSPAGLMLRGDALKAMGEVNKALAAYEGAMRGANMYLEPIKKLAEFHKDQGQDEEQLKYLEQLDRLSPLNVERKVDMGGINVKLGRPDQARNYFDDAVKITTQQAMNSVSSLARTIAEMCMQSAPELAEDYYRQTLSIKKGQLDKSDVTTFNSLGLALRQQGRWKEAIEEYQNALKVSPDDENLYYNCAMAYAEGKEYRKALEELERARRINPQLGEGTANILYNMAFIYNMAGRFAIARELCEKALSEQPDNKKALALLQKLKS